ncbi:hypothetical protein OH799_18710 [Nocardia sp. NBC_00881]|uniref:hypothetical protein n=1 Tax=Nocardia sp. NBC_00881 TaxID=2975995 RepID=UPI0038663A02|nr:hypothetical protein OH799_18710 [Nocardia sp. NBC_00881]
MSTTSTTATAAAAGRLPNGELRRLVAAALAAEPVREQSPREIAAGLGRSSGAVGNALEALVKSGHADLTSAAPRRYRVTATTATAAARPLLPPPRRPLPPARRNRPARPRTPPPPRPPPRRSRPAPAMWWPAPTGRTTTRNLKSMSRRWRRLAAALGLPDGVTPHSLRKHVGTEAVEARLDATKVADQLGNTARVLRNAYVRRHQPHADVTELIGNRLASALDEVARRRAS